MRIPKKTKNKKYYLTSFFPHDLENIFDTHNIFKRHISQYKKIEAIASYSNIQLALQNISYYPKDECFYKTNYYSSDLILINSIVKTSSKGREVIWWPKRQVVSNTKLEYHCPVCSDENIKNTAMFPYDNINITPSKCNCCNGRRVILTNKGEEFISFLKRHIDELEHSINMIVDYSHLL